MCHKCGEPIEKPCGCKPKGCQIKDLGSDCVILSRVKLDCTNLETGTVLTEVLQELDAAICELTSQSVNLDNIGAGAEIYQGDTLQGTKQLRSLRSTNTDLVITQTADEITFTVSAKGADTFTSTGVLNPSTGLVTFTRNNGSTYFLDLAALLQVQSNVLERDTTAKAFIQNKNPTKTITGSYTLSTADNDYVIVVNNTNAMTINIPSGLPDNFFAGFVQKGSADVTFSGFDIKPIGFLPIMIGQGHNAAVEVIDGTKFLFGNLQEE